MAPPITFRHVRHDSVFSLPPFVGKCLVTVMLNDEVVAQISGVESRGYSSYFADAGTRFFLNVFKGCFRLSVCSTGQCGQFDDRDYMVLWYELDNVAQTIFGLENENALLKERLSILEEMIDRPNGAGSRLGFEAVQKALGE